MPTYQIKAPNGQTYKIEGPDGATDDQVRSEVLRQHPDAGKAEEKGPELGPGNLPPGWAVPMPGLPPEPKGAAWSKPPMSTVMSGILGVGGPSMATALGAPALVGAAGGGALAGAGDMPSNPLLGAAFGAALNTAIGTVGGLVGKGLGKAGYGFEKARDALKDAAEAVRDKVPQGLKVFNLPMSKEPMTFDEAITALGKSKTADQFKTSVADFVKQLNEIELGKTIKLPGAAKAGTAAGETFAGIAPKELWEPSAFSRVANQIASTPEGQMALGIPGLGAAMAGKGLGAKALEFLGSKLLP